MNTYSARRISRRLTNRRQAGNRPWAMFTQVVGFCTGLPNRGAVSASLNTSGTSANQPDNLASCLALLARKSADLSLLLERWEELPVAVRAGIVTMVWAVSGTRKESAE